MKRILVFFAEQPSTSSLTKGRCCALRALLVLSFMLLICSAERPAQAQPPVAAAAVSSDAFLIIDQRAADKVRGGYVYSFSRYVTWPTRDRTSLRIGVVENGRLTKLLELISKRKQFTDRQTGRKYPIEVVRLGQSDSVDGAFDLVYIGSSVSLVNRSRILEGTRGKSTLMIADSTDNANAAFSSTVRFVIRDGAVKFDLNLRDARERGLLLDAKLMTAASFIMPDSEH